MYYVLRVPFYVLCHRCYVLHVRYSGGFVISYVFGIMYYVFCVLCYVLLVMYYVLCVMYYV